MTPDKNDNAENAENREHSPPKKAESPSPSNATSWLMHGLNRIEDQIAEIREDISELKERIARVEEKIKSVPEIDRRLRRIEHIIWTVFGIVVAIGVLWGAIKVFLSYFTVMPKQ